MGLAQRYGSAKGFVHGYFFDRRNPESLRTAMDDLQKEAASLAGNLGVAALRHAKLASSAFDRAAMNLAPELALQKVRDCLQAFAGAVLRNDDVSVERKARAFELQRLERV